MKRGGLRDGDDNDNKIYGSDIYDALNMCAELTERCKVGEGDGYRGRKRE